MRMEPIAEARRQFKHPVIGHEDNHVSGGVEHGGADLAGLKMAINIGAHRWVDVVVDIGGDVLPNVIAVDSHVRPPNQPFRLGANPFSLGARFRCKSARARCRRTLTAASLIPSAAAVWRISISSMSLSTTTLR